MHALFPVFPWKRATFLHERDREESEPSSSQSGSWQELLQGGLKEEEGPLTAATPEECLAAAVALGEDLAGKAVSCSPIGMDLSEGLGGLALFLGYLARRTGRGDFEERARAALEPVREDWRKQSRGGDTGVGVFVGRGAAVYVLGHLATLWNEPSLLDEVLEGLPPLEPLIATDTRLGLLSGAAGLAVALLGLYRKTGNIRLLEAARRCGDRLMATAVPLPEGAVGWKVEGAARPLAGFSHGAAGICWALVELAGATGVARYVDLALRGLAYERSLLVLERGNSTWCHGAAGIALGRLLLLRHLDRAGFRAELSIAIETTLRGGFGGNHCLCHGDVGNLEVLHLAGELLRVPRWTRAALERAAVVVRQGRESGWRCGLPRGSESPGMLMGLAGIGHGLLRLSAPEHVPSVLALQPPR